MSKARQVFGIVMTVGVIGLTIYAIKKYYDSKRQDEQSIGLDEAREIVAEGRVTDDELDALLKKDANGDGGFIYAKPADNIDIRDRSSMSPDPRFKSETYNNTVLNDEQKENPIFETCLSCGRNFCQEGKSVCEHCESQLDDIIDEQIQEVKDQARGEASYHSSHMTPEGKVELGPQGRRIGFTPDELAAMKEAEESEEEGYDPLLDGDDPEEIQISKQYFEVEKDVIEELRYDPNSVDAREQFIGMELASLGRDNDTRDIVGMLYDHPFVPTCDEDQNLKTRLIDHRVRFFGLVSRWSREVSYGDVIMYYGRSAEYNCDNDVRYWVDYFLTCGDLNNITFTSDEFDERINLLNSHKFFNEDSQSYGLFGLTAKQMTEAAVVAKGRIDECITYDIEFNQFLQGIV